MSEGELAKWAGATSGAATVDTLVTLANNRGGRDNITVLVLTIQRLADATVPLIATKDLEVLRRCDLFSTCTQAELEAIGAVCRVRDLPPGSVIFSEGDPGWECYIIARGEISITKNGSPLADLTVGDHFGEMSLVDTPSRGAQAKTKGPVKLFVLTRRDFEGLMRQDAILATRVMWRLSAHLARMVRATTKVLINR
jgi:CRP-like cAMP-binding protein